MRVWVATGASIITCVVHLYLGFILGDWSRGLRRIARGRAHDFTAGFFSILRVCELHKINPCTRSRTLLAYQ